MPTESVQRKAAPAVGPQVEEKLRPRREAEEDLKAAVWLDDYEEGRKLGGLKAWNEAHEALMKRFYAGRPLPETMPSQELNHYLEEASFACRQRSTQGEASSVLHTAINLGHSSTQKDIEAFEAMSPSQREAVLLETFAKMARIRPEAYSWQHKLTPELTLERLTADKGLETLFSFLRENFLVPDFHLHPVPNEAFFRKFGISTSTDESRFPSSQAVRAFAQEHLLIRHSHLETFVMVVRCCIAGKPIPKVGFIGNVAADYTPENAPHLAEKATTADLTKNRTNVHEELCAWCHKSASAAEMGKLNRCFRCLKVGRIQTYCSRICQTADWTLHKPTCGKRLSDLSDVPVFSRADTAESKPLHPIRRALLRILENSPHEYWGFIGETTSGVIGFDGGGLSAEQSTRIRRCMRKVAFAALKDDDRDCIDLLAVIVSFKPLKMNDSPHPCRPGMSGKASGFDPYPTMLDNFKVMFNMTDDQVDQAFNRGIKVAEKPEWLPARELQMHFMGELYEEAFSSYFEGLIDKNYPTLAPEEKDLYKRAVRGIFRGSLVGRAEQMAKELPAFSDKLPQ